MRRFLLAAALLALAAPAEAASTAAPVIPGYLTNTPQPNCTTTPCFVPNGATSSSLGRGPVSTNPAVTASAYSANNAIGGLQTVSLFRSTTQPSGVLGQIGIASKGGLTATEAIYAFTKVPVSTCTDKAAFVLSSTDLPYLSPGFPVSVTPSTTAGTTQTTAYFAINEPVSNADTTATTNLYFCAVTTGTPTPASTTDLVFTYTLLQD